MKRSIFLFLQVDSDDDSIVQSLLFQAGKIEKDLFAKCLLYVGERFELVVCGQHVDAYLISGWIHQAKEFIAPYAFNGYTDSIRFNQWLEQCLLPALGEGWAIILVNASFHKANRTKELVEKSNCNLLYLPPYSPDFNQIENQWATLKSCYKTFKQRGYEHENAIDASFTVHL